MLTRPAGPRP